MAEKINWAAEIKPLLKKYRGKKHPLEFNNLYELMVMVILAAQTSDKLINSIAPDLFKSFPDMQSLAKATTETLFPRISKVIGFRKKGEWLIKTAQILKLNKNIPLTMEELVKLPGIGRKSANVIMHQAGVPAEGVIVDLHVVRVAPRLGITKSTDPKQIEADIMKKLPQKDWDAGMAISFLGREICHNRNPEHEKCVMKNTCAYYKKIHKIK